MQFVKIRSAQTTRRAFSFTEIVIVVLVIGILAAAAIPKYQESLTKNTLLSAARRVAADIELARSTAMTQSSNQLIDFDATHSTYQLVDLPDLDNSNTYFVDLGDAPYRSHLVVVDFDGQQQLTFNGFGIPSSAGHVRLQSGKYIRQVSVSATGVVEVEPLLIPVAPPEAAETEVSEAI